MAQFRITKQVDFGPYTILNKDGCASCFVPLNDYAPKVGEVIEGTIETKPIPDGNGHTTMKTGIVWPIRTNGSASTTGQTSIQFISQDYFEPVVAPGNGSNTNPSNPSNGASDSVGETICWICDNKLPVLLALLLLVAFILILNAD